MLEIIFSTLSKRKALNFYQDEQDWQWLFKHAIDWDKVLPLYFKSFPTEEGFKNKEDILLFFEDILSQTGSWAGKTNIKGLFIK